MVFDLFGIWDPFQMTLKPRERQVGYLLKRPGFFKQVGCSGHNRELVLRL